jgi:predicted nucleic acid-binding protein
VNNPPPVVNASPLILFAKGGCFELLRTAGEELSVPTAVVEEIRRRGRDDLTVQCLNRSPWIKEVREPPIPPIIQAWDLGPGESSVLAWALANPGVKAIIDDLAARRCASILNIPLGGTLGLILSAKKRGVIPQAKPLIEKMRQSGMYISERLLNQALALVGE